MITLTDNALAEIRRRTAGAAPVVRLSTRPGGCSGTKYVLDVPGVPAEGDASFPRSGVTLVVDPASLPLLEGLELDYVDSLVGGGFAFANPNAQGTCGCGASFSPLQQL